MIIANGSVSTEALVEYLSPQRFPHMSAKMGAIVQYMLNQDELWASPAIEELHCTSDGYILARHRGECGAAFMCTAADLRRNWLRLVHLAGMPPHMMRAAANLLQTRITWH